MDDNNAAMRKKYHGEIYSPMRLIHQADSL